MSEKEPRIHHPPIFTGFFAMVSPRSWCFSMFNLKKVLGHIYSHCLEDFFGGWSLGIIEKHVFHKLQVLFSNNHGDSLRWIVDLPQRVISSWKIESSNNGISSHTLRQLFSLTNLFRKVHGGTICLWDVLWNKNPFQLKEVARFASQTSRNPPSSKPTAEGMGHSRVFPF